MILLDSHPSGRHFLQIPGPANVLDLLHGLAEAIDMLPAEELGNAFARHRRMGEATRLAVRAWGPGHPVRRRVGARRTRSFSSST